MLFRPFVTFFWMAVIAVLAAAGTSLSGAEVGGVKFDDPVGWTSAPKPMRSANYTIPAAAGDRQNGEMAVYYFGPGQGGGVEANLRRWLGQFVSADGSPMDAADADRSDEQAGGMQVTVLDVTGTYLFKPFPMAPQATPMPGYRMLAVIVQGSGRADLLQADSAGEDRRPSRAAIPQADCVASTLAARNGAHPLGRVI